MSFLKKQAGPAFFSLADASAVKDFVKVDDDKDVVGEQQADPHVRVMSMRARKRHRAGHSHSLPSLQIL